MAAPTARVPCFVPPTPPLPRGGAPRLLTLLDQANPYMFLALRGSLSDPKGVVCPEALAFYEMDATPVGMGHVIARHADGTTLLALWDGHTHHWFPTALHHKATPNPTDLPRLLEEADRWRAVYSARPFGWDSDSLLPVHMDTAQPWHDATIALHAGQRVVRHGASCMPAFLGLAVLFLERHPQLVWDNLHYMMGLLGVRGQWAHAPQLMLTFPKRQGTFTAQSATRLWGQWSKRFLREVVQRRSLPTDQLAGWYWSTPHHTHHNRLPYRAPHAITLSLNGTTHPSQQGRTHDLNTQVSSHERLALHGAFRRAAPDTYAAWHGT